MRCRLVAFYCELCGQQSMCSYSVSVNRTKNASRYPFIFLHHNFTKEEKPFYGRKPKWHIALLIGLCAMLETSGSRNASNGYFDQRERTLRLLLMSFIKIWVCFCVLHKNDYLWRSPSGTMERSTHITIEFRGNGRRHDRMWIVSTLAVNTCNYCTRAGKHEEHTHTRHAAHDIHRGGLRVISAHLGVIPAATMTNVTVNHTVNMNVAHTRSCATSVFVWPIPVTMVRNESIHCYYKYRWICIRNFSYKSHVYALLLQLFSYYYLLALLAICLYPPVFGISFSLTASIDSNVSVCKRHDGFVAVLQLVLHDYGQNWILCI